MPKNKCYWANVEALTILSNVKIITPRMWDDRIWLRYWIKVSNIHHLLISIWGPNWFNLVQPCPNGSKQGQCWSNFVQLEYSIRIIPYLKKVQFINHIKLSHFGNNSPCFSYCWSFVTIYLNKGFFDVKLRPLL